MTDVLAAGLLVSAGLLSGAGLAKLIRPDATARAMRQAGLLRRHEGAWVRVGAAVEVLIAGAALTVGGLTAAVLMAASYLAFAAFTVAALRRGWALSSCGCFGEADAAPSRVHVVIDVLLATAAVGSAIGSTPGELITRNPAQGTLLCALAALIAGLTYLVMARLPRLRAAMDLS